MLAGLRRCEVLGLRFEDVQVADRRLAVVAGNGGHHLVVPAANRFFGSLGAYLHDERPAAAGTDRVFVVLKAPGAACRCRRRGWMRSWTAPTGGLGWSTRPARALLPHVSPRPSPGAGRNSVRVPRPPSGTHDLRHTHATLLLASRDPLKVVPERLGHASAVVTMTVYAHVLPGDQRAAAEGFAALVAAAAE